MNIAAVTNRHFRFASGATLLVGALAAVSSGACGSSSSGATVSDDSGAGGHDASSSGSSSGSGSSSSGSSSGSSSSGSSSGSSGGEDSGTDSGGGEDSGSSSGSSSGGSTGPFPLNPSFILGADISWTLEDEARGATYADSTGVKPIEEIMANNGFNYIRLRTFVEPSAQGGYAQGSANDTKAPGYGTPTGGWCSTAASVKMAQRVKKCGMGVFLDFHMRDTWASLGSQGLPSSWVGLSQTPEGPVSKNTKQNNVFQAAHDYVAGVMAAMVAGGVKPDMVQIGNETNGGMSGISLTNQPAFETLVNAGITAVRETDPAIIVWAQNGRPRPDSAGGSNFDGWVDDYLSGKAPNSPAIDEDGICGSTYGTTDNGADWMTCFQYVITTYNKPVMSCEYTDEAPDYPAGALINGLMHGFANGKGRGAFIWEPTRYPGVNSHTLFTQTSGPRYTANAAMADYPTLAKSYGLPVPSGTCSE